MFTATLADLLSILEKATSGETGIHASGGRAPQLTAAACVFLALHCLPRTASLAPLAVYLFLCTTCLAPILHLTGLPCSVCHAVKSVLIGKVPDRGGRPEGRKREADMPEWKARQVRCKRRLEEKEGVWIGRARVEGTAGGLLRTVLFSPEERQHALALVHFGVLTRAPPSSCSPCLPPAAGLARRRRRAGRPPRAGPGRAAPRRRRRARAGRQRWARGRRQRQEEQL